MIDDCKYKTQNWIFAKLSCPAVELAKKCKAATPPGLPEKKLSIYRSSCVVLQLCTKHSASHFQQLTVSIASGAALDMAGLDMAGLDMKESCGTQS
jgi:hypothetical protein